jgi:tRNA (pseudouridine54-N1)-methyltransferase
MRRFIVLGQKAKASGDFLLADIPSTSGRLDVLLRALRAGLLISHGVRRDSQVYLVLLGEPERERVVRFSGAAARYLRPDERNLATTLKKALAVQVPDAGFVAARPGIDVAAGGVSVLRSELGTSAVYVLEQGAPDVRTSVLDLQDSAFVLGDHLGIRDIDREFFLALGARPLSLGPTELYTEDAIAVLTNELDRRAAAYSGEATAAAGER